MSKPRSSKRRGSCATGNTCGSSPGRPLTSYQEVVDDYIQQHRARAAEEFAFFKDKDLKTAIRYAARAMRPDGKRHSHQARYRGKTLAEAERCSQDAASVLKRCRSFAELHEMFEALIGPIPGVGPLGIYDIASRVGAHLGLEPEFVYLHSGTRRGAEALGLGHGRSFLDRAELPAPFHVLRPREIEDCLCIYAETLEALQMAQRNKPTPRAIPPFVRKPTRQWDVNDSQK
jgi:hypothetical protein